jgi:multidrug efflux pump subunit AcrA (membrane-fusion protein)
VEDAKKALDRAQTTWEGDWLAYKAIIIKLMREAKEDDSWSFSGDTYKFDSADQIAIEGYLKKAEIESSKKTEDSSDESTGTLPSELSKQREAYNTLLKDQNDIDAKKQAYDRARDDQSDASSNASQQRRNIRDKLDEAESDLAAAERQLRTAQQELDAASGANAQLKEQIRAWEATQRQQETSITTLEANLAALQEKQTAYKAALETVNAKQRELETTLSGKDIDKQLNNLELQSMNIEIEKQQELVDKYTKDSVGAEIKSPVSGVVSAINVSAGKDTTPDQAMAVIDVVDRGYILKIPVTNEQAKQVKVGDTAEVTNYYWGNEITAVLESITSDPSSAGQKKLLVFRVSGDIEAGTNITLSVGQRSAPMDAIVPKSAVREDANGKFVLVVTSRSTPLGNRYTATRADIQVLAEDDTSVAVSGLASSDYVITTSSKPLDAGSQVRMVENPS